jgi:hypothetical protein
MGGEFDYELFLAEMGSLTQQGRDAMDQFFDEAKDFEVLVPQFRID